MGYFVTASTLNAAGLNAQDIVVLFLSRYRLNIYFDRKSKLVKNKLMHLANTDMNSCPKILATLERKLKQKSTVRINNLYQLN